MTDEETTETTKTTETTETSVAPPEDRREELRTVPQPVVEETTTTTEVKTDGDTD